MHAPLNFYVLAGHLPKKNLNAWQSDKKANHAKEKFGIYKYKKNAGFDAENNILAQNNRPLHSKSTPASNSDPSVQLLAELILLASFTLKITMCLSTK